MSTLVTQQAPDFTADTVFPDNSIKSMTLSSLKGKYVILLFYPADFSFVCPSEIIAFNDKLKEFQKRKCEILGVSVDSAYSHYAWKQCEPKKGGIGDIQFPLVADITKSITRSFGILYTESVALRGLFLIDKKGIVRHCVINDLPLGRSVDEALRILDALQFFEEKGELCPANWHKGSEGMKGTQAGVAKYLSSHTKSKSK